TSGIFSGSRATGRMIQAYCLRSKFYRIEELKQSKNTISSSGTCVSLTHQKILHHLRPWGTPAPKRSVWKSVQILHPEQMERQDTRVQLDVVPFALPDVLRARHQVMYPVRLMLVFAHQPQGYLHPARLLMVAIQIHHTQQTVAVGVDFGISDDVF